jgi:hypothetical protein
VLSFRPFVLDDETREDEALDDDDGVIVGGGLVEASLVRRLLLCLGGWDDSSELFGNLALKHQGDRVPTTHLAAGRSAAIAVLWVITIPGTREGIVA